MERWGGCLEMESKTHNAQNRHSTAHGRGILGFGQKKAPRVLDLGAGWGGGGDGIRKRGTLFGGHSYLEGTVCKDG